jgi:hypothetical protein
MGMENLTLKTQYLVGTSITGRAIASLGGRLTEKEKEYVELVYRRLRVGEKISERSPITAKIETTKPKRKISISDAVKWFIREYPKASIPLQEKLKEKKAKSKTNLAYGFKTEKTFEDLGADFYIDLIREISGINGNEAGVLYHGVLLPFMQRIESEKEKGLTKMLIKG